MLRFPLLIPVLASLAISSSASADPQVWSFAIDGGGGCDTTYGSFYSELRFFDKKMQDYNVPASQRVSLFGFTQDGKDVLCTSDYPGVNPPAEVQKSEAAKEKADETLKNSIYNEFLKAQPADQCKLAQPLFRFILDQDQASGWHVSDKDFESIFHHSMKDLDGKGSMLSGPASSTVVRKEFTRLYAGLKRGDQLYLNLNDHGDVLDQSVPEDVWKEIGVPYNDQKTLAMSLGGSGDALTTQQLDQYLKPLVDRGITVHIDVDTCFAGGFSTALSKPGVCVTAVTDQDHSAFGDNFTFINSEASQLKAFACALVNHGINRPITSLDTIVDQWEKQNQAVSQVLDPCLSSQGNLKEVADAVDHLKEKVATAPLRNELTQLFESDYVHSYENCIKSNPDIFAGLDPSPAQPDIDQQVFSKARHCIDDPSLQLSPVEKYVLQMTTRSVLGAGEFTPSESGYPEREIARQRKFLQNADETHLKQYKAALCCLAYDPKTKSAPALCRRP